MNNLFDCPYLDDDAIDTSDHGKIMDWEDEEEEDPNSWMENDM